MVLARLSDALRGVFGSGAWGGGAGNAGKDVGIADLPEGRYFGLENFGNTCYANSVVQALYACAPLRREVLEYAASASARRGQNETLLSCLAELFQTISQQRRRTGTLSPRKFVQRVRADNELFRSYMHQDAHEFLNFLLNDLCETLEKEHKQRAAGPPAAQDHDAPAWKSFVQQLFQGCLTSETCCMTCERVTRRAEPFLDLSLDIEPNASLSACLRKFGHAEVLKGREKFRCDFCGGGTYQEARRRFRFAKLPNVLALHLKRFKYVESLGRYRKLCYRVPFPTTLRIPAEMMTSEGGDDATAAAGAQQAAGGGTPALPPLYRLFAVVVHLGSGPNHGHYVCLTKSGGGTASAGADGTSSAPSSPPSSPTGGVPMDVDGSEDDGGSPPDSADLDVSAENAASNAWVQFDDDLVEVLSADKLPRFYGATTDSASPSASEGSVLQKGGPYASPAPNTEHGYLLFYQRVGAESSLA